MTEQQENAKQETKQLSKKQFLELRQIILNKIEILKQELEIIENNYQENEGFKVGDKVTYQCSIYDQRLKSCKDVQIKCYVDKVQEYLEELNDNLYTISTPKKDGTQRLHGVMYVSKFFNVLQSKLKPGWKPE